MSLKDVCYLSET